MIQPSQNSQKSLAVVVPFLNEEENLPLLFDRIAAAMRDQPEALSVIFVDDGSTDGSATWAAQASRKDPRIKLLRLSRNFGHQVAITAGMDHADADAVVIIDADLQDPPEVIPELLKKWREGYEIVYAVRSSRAGETWLKKFLAASFYRAFRSISSVDIPIDAGDFRLVDRKVVGALREVRELHRFVRGLTCWVGFQQCAVRYERAARHAGKTKYPVWKSMNLAWDAITSFSGAPLRWMAWFGVFASLAGGLLALRMIAMKVLGTAEAVPGWTSTVSLILILGGLQLLCLGLMGQYVSRIYEEAKRRPLYFVTEKVGDL
jgi:polyisoprenyl-phosphate glycosyltransferase